MQLKSKESKTSIRKKYSEKLREQQKLKLEKNQEKKARKKSTTTPKIQTIWRSTDRKTNSKSIPNNKSSQKQISFNQKHPKTNNDNLTELKRIIEKFVFNNYDSGFYNFILTTSFRA